MTILWQLRQGTVRDVLSRTTRPLAYTSVSTILRILARKKVLDVGRKGRRLVFTPRIRKAQYQATSLRHLVTHVFEGRPDALLRKLKSLSFTSRRP